MTQVAEKGKKEDGQNFAAKHASSIAYWIVLTFKEKGGKRKIFLFCSNILCGKIHKRDTVGIFLSLIYWLKISHRGLLCFDPGSKEKRENGQNFTANQASRIVDSIVLKFNEKGERKKDLLILFQ